jgi:hypothetical protein
VSENRRSRLGPSSSGVVIDRLLISVPHALLTAAAAGATLWATLR